MTVRPTIDVSRLPSSAFDTRSPVWWGNTLLLVVESTTVALLLASYFYLWRNQAPWPPPRVNAPPTLDDPVPDLGAATVDLVLMLVSVIPMAWADRAVRKGDRQGALSGLLIAVALGTAALVLRFFEYQGLKFSWDENAYASVVWAILSLHLVYLGLGLGEAALTGVWVLSHGLDERRAVDVTLSAVYWYWVVGVWVLFYGVVYWWPRVA